MSSRKVRELQQKLSEITGSKASLSSWQPHVTVGDGVEVDDEQLQELQNEMIGIADQSHTFLLSLKGFSTLENWKGGEDENVSPFVIYLDVHVNPDLTRLIESIANVTTKIDKWYLMPEPYVAHCTLAFRDLSEEGFKLGVEYLQKTDLSLTATIDHLALVEKLPSVDRELVRFNFAE